MSRQEHESGREHVGVNPGALKEVAPRDLVIRFAFGAAISVVAGLVSLAWGPRAGGMFLAFPAILPATLTLLEKKHDTGTAVDDVRGAVIGGIGLGAFAVVGWYLIRHDVTAPLALGGALGAWVVTSVAIHLVVSLISVRAQG